MIRSFWCNQINHYNYLQQCSNKAVVYLLQEVPRKPTLELVFC